MSSVEVVSPTDIKTEFLGPHSFMKYDSEYDDSQEDFGIGGINLNELDNLRPDGELYPLCPLDYPDDLDISILDHFNVLYDRDDKKVTNKNLVLDIDETMVRTVSNVEDLYRLGMFTCPSLLPLRRRTYKFKFDNLNSTPG